MKKTLSIAMVALMVAGSAAFACDTCAPCAAKKVAAGKKAACTKCDEKKADDKCTAKKAEKKCGADCAKPCCAKKPAATE